MNSDHPKTLVCATEVLVASILILVLVIPWQALLAWYAVLPSVFHYSPVTANLAIWMHLQERLSDA
jgi:hypothetical protein